MIAIRAADDCGSLQVAVIFDLVQPLIAVGRGVGQLRELRRDPFRHRGRIGAPPARYGARHLGIHRR